MNWEVHAIIDLLIGFRKARIVAHDVVLRIGHTLLTIETTPTFTAVYRVIAAHGVDTQDRASNLILERRWSLICHCHGHDGEKHVGTHCDDEMREANVKRQQVDEVLIYHKADSTK